ncbi:N-acetylglucosaminyldiphosphoundecaprenol N-acetyl-beta-D-mannosaminyltransferase [Krasilnikovia cinnamomea]|uniref:N-acetylglucosaminyldiphosphoundecaprenol N-acetyl-beta-D-mannosaminyltransferase n=1 Tax=Krasilnikovia cinnamomea TaxID=349313 RepID=A0A4Q7ZM62_9ACTN|nr:WecB/TagA/CpsF family glycosyltransferase [Krasilnikovia cinnamomea]RZU52072.1 N-acetylglucosaminyldiphosphoundecaprenol N-acetyl-beta-D-mannosaminyltransferase [Krasilnikovia cinnamomea]
MTTEAFERVYLDGTGFDRITEAEVVAVVRDALACGRGGRIITPNVDILRMTRANPGLRAFLDDADLVVADGMPLVWASRLTGMPLPERVAGSSLVWSLSEGLGRDDRSIFVIGGAPGADDLPDGATRAADRLAAACPGLRVGGTLCPEFGFEHDETRYAQFCAKVVDAQPDVVLVGLGFPKQEQVISRLRTDLPQTWFVGCGAAVNFVAGDVRRAPRWMQRTGLEWVHRLGSEPRRLARRYLSQGAPYALRLLAVSARR